MHHQNNPKKKNSRIQSLSNDAATCARLKTRRGEAGQARAPSESPSRVCPGCAESVLTASREPEGGEPEGEDGEADPRWCPPGGARRHELPKRSRLRDGSNASVESTATSAHAHHQAQPMRPILRSSEPSAP